MRAFFLRTSKTSGQAPLYVRVRSTAFNGRVIQLNTEIEVSADKWGKPKYFSTVEGKAVEALLHRTDEAITSALSKDGCTEDDIKMAVRGVVHAEEMAAERQRQEEERKAAAERKRQEEERRKGVLAYLAEFVSNIKSGKRKNGQENYSPNTVKAWESFSKLMKAYCASKRRRLTWDDVDKSLVADFTHWMERGGYMVTSINKYLICFRALVGYSYDDGWHTNAKADAAFSKKRVRDELKAREIYLTADELQALYEMKLDGTRAIYRDVFLVGCYTCQRFSDYSKIEKGNIYTTERGTKIIALTQQKTGNKVYVPVLNGNLEAILAKYGYNVPTVCDVVLNRYIKEILHELSAAVPSLAVEERTMLTMKERSKNTEYKTDGKGNVVKPRWAMVSTHTARRTGITLLYKSKLFDIPQMMHVSGHKDTKTFMDYIKLSGQEVADSIAEIAEKSNVNPF